MFSFYFKIDRGVALLLVITRGTNRRSLVLDGENFLPLPFLEYFVTVDVILLLEATSYLLSKYFESNASL